MVVVHRGKKLREWLHVLTFRDRSLMTKLTLYTALLIVIPMTLIGYITYVQTSRTLEADARHYSWQIIEQVKRYIEDYLRDYELITLKIVNHPDTVALLKLRKMQDIEASELIPPVRNVLKNFAYSQSDVLNISISLDSLLVIQSANMEETSLQGLEQDHRIASMPLTGPPHVYSRNILWNGREEPVITMVKRIVHPQTLGSYGMLVIDLNVKRLHEVAREIKLSANGYGYLFIADEQGRIVYHPDSERIGGSLSHELYTSLQQGKNGSFTADDPTYRDEVRFDSTSAIEATVALSSVGSGVTSSEEAKPSPIERNFYTYSTSDKLGWHIITVLPYDQLMSSRTYVGETIMKTTAVFIIVGYILSLGLATSLVGPIRRLYRYMRRVEIGDLKGRVPVYTRDEIGQLSIGFNRMVQRLSQLLEEVYVSKLRETEMRLQQKQSELKMLQAQMNPHFLYNSLETIRGMALEQEMHDIATMSSSLVHILRYSVESSGNTVLIRQEMEMVAIYLQIQQYRFGDRLRYKLHLPAWASEQRIVKLSLQPLVENCIIHGLERMSGMTHIEMKLGRTSESLFTILIVDNGPGIPEERLQELRDQLSSGRSSEEHVGLMNVHRRIRHIFGESYGLLINSEVGKGTEVEVVLPYTSEFDVVQ